jgi:hypothetical protein
LCAEVIERGVARFVVLRAVFLRDVGLAGLMIVPSGHVAAGWQSFETS